MKRIIIIVIIPLLLLLTGCGLVSTLLSLPDKSTESWQTIFVDGVGSFRVPTEWIVEQQDEVLYITDKPREDESHTTYLIGTVRTRQAGETSPNIQPHELLDGVEKGDILSSPVYSNGARLYLIEYTIQGKKEEHYLIDCSKNKLTTVAKLQLLVWDMYVVDENLATNIAKTINMES